MSNETTDDLVANLYDLFSYREELFTESTGLILDNIKPALNGIIQYIGVSPDKSEWESVDLMGEVVIFRLRVNTDKRESVTNNLLYRVVTVGLPLELVATATDEETIKMFLQTVEEAKKYSPEEMESEELTDESVADAVEERKTKKVLH